jgi:hypothetical protein
MEQELKEARATIEKLQQYLRNATMRNQKHLAYIICLERRVHELSSALESINP